MAGVQRIKKHNRSGSSFNMGGALRDMEGLFLSQNRACSDLCASLFSWWRGKYAAGPELDDGAVEKIAAVNSFVNCEGDTDALDAEDWARIKEEVGYEAENLPLETLSAMMKAVVDHGAI